VEIKRKIQYGHNQQFNEKLKQANMVMEESESTKKNCNKLDQTS
jgi:hypothetical protein